jgi:pyruvate formate lyase activating enzyme
MLGRTWTLPDLTRDILKDRAYFEASGGGVTLSGGEPTLQAGFAGALARNLRQEGIHIALDTCGLCDPSALDALLPFVDLVLFDVKIPDRERHKIFTGRSNETILENLKKTADHLKALNHSDALWIRTPVIPGATDDRNTIRTVGKLLAGLPSGVIARWELCAFNNLCRSKYHRLDRPWAYDDSPLMTGHHMNSLLETARQSGIDPSVVLWTGTVSSLEKNHPADSEHAAKGA